MSEFVSSFREVRDAFGKGAYEGAQILMADVPLSPSAAKLLPLWMSVGNEPRGTLLVAKYNRPLYTEPYSLAGLFIHVKTPIGRGIHPCWMVATDDLAIIYGRDFVGLPKKGGQVDIVRDRDRLTARVERKGSQILNLEAILGTPAPPEPVYDQKMFCIGGPGTAHLFTPVWLMRVREEHKSVWDARVSIEYGNAPADPLGSLITGGPLRARFVTCDVLRPRYMLPVGFAGPVWFVRTFRMRFG